MHASSRIYSLQSKSLQTNKNRYNFWKWKILKRPKMFAMNCWEKHQTMRQYWNIYMKAICVGKICWPPRELCHGFYTCSPTTPNIWGFYWKKMQNLRNKKHKIAIKLFKYESEQKVSSFFLLMSRWIWKILKNKFFLEIEIKIQTFWQRENNSLFVFTYRLKLERSAGHYTIFDLHKSSIICIN